MRNVYPSPSLEYLQRYAPDINFLFGEMRVTHLEVQTSLTDEGAFVALLTARLRSTLDDMVAYLKAPTFPVHDLPRE